MIGFARVHGYCNGHNDAAWRWRNPDWGADAWGLGLPLVPLRHGLTLRIVGDGPDDPGLSVSK